jgi:hypothetical protein
MLIPFTAPRNSPRQCEKVGAHINCVGHNDKPRFDLGGRRLFNRSVDQECPNGSNIIQPLKPPENLFLLVSRRTENFQSLAPFQLLASDEISPVGIVRQTREMGFKNDQDQLSSLPLILLLFQGFFIQRS